MILINCGGASQSQAKAIHSQTLQKQPASLTRPSLAVILLPVSSTWRGKLKVFNPRSTKTSRPEAIAIRNEISINFDLLQRSLFQRSTSAFQKPRIDPTAGKANGERRNGERVASLGGRMALRALEPFEALPLQPAKGHEDL